MKKSKILISVMAILMLFCMLAVTSYAAQSAEKTSGVLKYVVLDDGTVKITKYTGTAESYTIPSKIGSKAVTVIGSYSFSSLDKLKTLVIPGSVKKIEYSSIYWCSALKAITIKDGKLQNIDPLAIDNCWALETINIPKNVKSVGTIMQCKALKKFVVSAENPYICSIDGVLFSKDKKTLLMFPSGKDDGMYEVPSTVKTIVDYAFYEAKLEKIYIPKTVETIEESAFAYSHTSYIYTNASKAPAKWKDALYGTVVSYNYSIDDKIEVGETSKITATQSTSVIKLKWNKVEGATGYRVYQYSPSKGKYVKIASVKGTTTYRKDKYLKAGTTYKFRIQAYKKLSDGTVIWGKSSDIFETATECKAPGFTLLKSYQKSKAEIKWDAVVGATGYQLYYATSKNGTYKKIGSYPKDDLYEVKTFSNSASGKTIYFKVRAYTKVNGQTIFSQWSAVKSVKLK